MKIGVIIGSIRDERIGESVGRWVHEQGQERDGADYELVDLKSFDVPLLTTATVPAAAERSYPSEQVTAWSQAIDACDGYVFVTPEYNHGVPGAFKNAFDSIYPEWLDKAVSFVSYGAASGARAVEAWRLSVANANMFDIRATVAFNTATDFTGSTVQPVDRHRTELEDDVRQARGRHCGDGHAARLTDPSRAAARVRSAGDGPARARRPSGWARRARRA